MKNKLLITVVMILLTIGLLSGCGIKPKEEKPEKANKSEPVAEEEQEAKGIGEVAHVPEDLGYSGTIGEYYLDNYDATISPDNNGNSGVVFIFTFTNNSDKAITFTDAFDILAIQEGDYLPRTTIFNESNVSVDNTMIPVKPGDSYEVSVPYQEIYGDSDITVKVWEKGNDNSDYLNGVWETYYYET